MNTRTTVAAALLLTCLAAAAPAEDYMPLKEGNSWTYQGPANMELTMAVTGFEDVKGVRCAVVAATAAGENEKYIFHMTSDAAGVKTHKMKTPEKDVEFGQPAVQLKLPFTPGEKWQARLALFGADPEQAQVESVGREKVKVQTGEFECIKVRSTWKDQGGDVMVLESCYADGLGLVQLAVKEGDDEPETLKLTRTTVKAGGPATTPTATDAPRPAAGDYLPLKPGNAWTYRMPDGTQATQTVTGLAEVNGVRCAVVEMGAIALYLTSGPDGIRNHKIKDAQKETEFGQPDLLVKLPFKEGEKWQSKRVMGLAPTPVELESVGREKVKSPAGEFDCIKVRSTIGAAGQTVVEESYYADGVGLVLNVLTVAGKRVPLKELVKTNVKPEPAAKTGPGPAADRQCPNCRAKVAADAKFCTECGAKLPPPAPVRPENCPKCATKLAPDAKFCTECGTKIEAGPETGPKSPPATGPESAG